MDKKFSFSSKDLWHIALTIVTCWCVYIPIALGLQFYNALNMFQLGGVVFMYPCLAAWLFLGLSVYCIECIRSIHVKLDNLKYNTNLPDKPRPQHKFFNYLAGFVLTLIAWPYVIYLSIKRGEIK